MVRVLLGHGVSPLRKEWSLRPSKAPYVLAGKTTAATRMSKHHTSRK